MSHHSYLLTGGVVGFSLGNPTTRKAIIKSSAKASVVLGKFLFRSRAPLAKFGGKFIFPAYLAYSGGRAIGVGFRAPGNPIEKANVGSADFVHRVTGIPKSTVNRVSGGVSGDVREGDPSTILGLTLLGPPGVLVVSAMEFFS